jgi:hypothetical protein
MHDFQIDLCVMDALPNKHSAQAFAEDFNGRVQLAIYKEFDETADVRESKTLENGVLMDRTNTLDFSAKHWRDGSSVIVLDEFQYAPDVIPLDLDNPQDKWAFVQQLGQEVRDQKENPRTGKMRAVWVATGPDHYRHADNYCLAAYEQHHGGEIGEMQTIESVLTSSVRPDELDFAGPRSTYRSQY